MGRKDPLVEGLEIYPASHVMRNMAGLCTLQSTQRWQCSVLGLKLSQQQTQGTTGWFLIVVH